MYSNHPIDKINDVVAMLSFVACSLTWGDKKEYELNAISVWGLFNMLCVCQDHLQSAVKDLEAE